MAPRKLPSSDEVGVSMLEQLLRHSGKQRMRELVEPAAEETPAEDTQEGPNMEELEALLASQATEVAPEGEESKEPCPECGGKGCPACIQEE